MGQSQNPAKKAASTAAKKAAAKKAAAKKTTAKKTTTKKTAARRTSPHVPEPTQVSSIQDILNIKAGRLVALPSGLVFRLQRVDLQAFVFRGTVHNPLMEIVTDTLKKGKQADIGEMFGLEGEGEVDLEAIADMFESVQGVAVESVLEPKILPLPTEDDVRIWNEQNPEDLVEQPEELRREGKVYIDNIGEEDLMFIFDYAVGGTGDVETFREEARASMAALAQS